MKKVLLLSTGVLVAAANVTNAQGFSQVEKVGLELGQLAEKSGQLLKKKAFKAPQNVVSPDGKYEFFPVIGMPTTPFYMGGLINDKGAFVPITVPVHTPITYKGVTYVAKTASSSPAFNDFEGFQYSWEYYNPDTWLLDDILTSTGPEVTLNYTPIINLTTLPIPTMTMEYEGVEEETEAPYKVVLGGKALLPLKGDNGVEVTDIDFNTTAWLSSLNSEEDYCPEALFGTMTYLNSDETYTEGTKEWAMMRYQDIFEDQLEEPLADVEFKGIGYNLPYPGSPYLLSSATLYSWALFKQNTEVQIDVYEADIDGYPIGDALYSTNFVCAANFDPTRPTTSFRTPITINFTSTDEDGFELDYMVIDKPLVVTLTNFLTENVTSFQPWCFGYDRDADTYSSDLPFTAFTIMDLIGSEGTRVNNHQNYYNLWSFGTQGSSVYYSHKSFYVDIEAEFPYLEPSDLFVDQNDAESIAYQEDGNYRIAIPDGTTNMAIGILTSASNPDEIVIDDEDLPEWAIMEALDGIQYENQMNFIEVQFEFDGDYKNQSFTVPFLYKNLKMNLTLYNGDTAVSDVESVNEGKATYYDLQGRKLNNAPEKGIYILKEGNKVSKVIR